MIGRWLRSRWFVFLAGTLFGSLVLGRLVDQMESEALGEEVTNIIPNNSFEADGAGPAGADWLFDARKMEKKGKVSRLRESATDGAFILSLEPSPANASAGAEPLGVGQIIPASKLAAGKWSLSADLGAEGGASVVVGVVALRRNGSEVVRGTISASRGGLALERASTTIEIARPREVASLLVFVIANGGAGKAYVDHLVLGTESAIARVRDDDSPMVVQIRVNAQKVTRAIPRTLYGTNVEWIDNGNGIFEPRSGKFDQSVVRLARAAGVSQIRYPGGLFSDHFHWKESIGPRDRRPVKEHFPKGPSSKLVLGTDEALDLAQQMNAELFITANAGTGSPEEAAGWVAYCLEKGGGKNPVRYWEVGNEIYMKSFDANSPPAFDLRPADYADRVVAFAEAMRRVDPSIQIGAIGADNFTTVPLTDYADWTETVLAKASGSIDFLAVHNAYAPLVVDGQGDPRDIYLSLLAAPQHIRRSIDDVSRKIAKTPAADAERIKIAITEWGPFFQVGVTAPYVDHPKTLGSALFVASTMKVFLESPKVEIAHFFKLSEPTFMGWIGPRGRTMVAKAPLLAFELFTQHFGDELVESSTTSPTFEARSAGLMPSASKVPWFEVIASRSAAGKLYLIGINKNFQSPAHATIAVDGFQPADKGTAWTLTGTGMDAHTGTELPRIPGLNWSKQTEIPPFRRMNKGNPSEVTLTQRRLDGLTNSFEFAFPPRSVTSIEMTASEGESR